MQQAECGRSPRREHAPTGINQDFSRRAVFASVASAAILFSSSSLAALPALAAAGKPTAWSGMLSRHTALKSEMDALWTRYMATPNVDRDDEFNDRLEAFSALEVTAWNDLMSMPSPDLAALRWKLEQVLVLDPDGSTASWADYVIQPVLRDIARLLAD